MCVCVCERISSFFSLGAEVFCLVVFQQFGAFFFRVVEPLYHSCLFLFFFIFDIWRFSFWSSENETVES